MTNEGQFERAIEAIDTANADDPNRVFVRGRERPKELAHAELATEWVRRLVASPSEALLLAVRSHHLRRWASPRSGYPTGRPGYLRWRKDLQRRHAEEVAAILVQAGYSPELIERVKAIVQKRGLGVDAEVQAFEDALCLVFIETQLATFTSEHPDGKAHEVLRKTLRKMSPEARDRALAMDLPGPVHAALAAAVEAARRDPS